MENFPVNVNTAGVCQLAKITVPGGEKKGQKIENKYIATCKRTEGPCSVCPPWDRACCYTPKQITIMYFIILVSPDLAESDSHKARSLCHCEIISKLSDWKIFLQH